jgi:hypothetical protein
MLYYMLVPHCLQHPVFENHSYLAVPLLQVLFHVTSGYFYFAVEHSIMFSKNENNL